MVAREGNNSPARASGSHGTSEDGDSGNSSGSGQEFSQHPTDKLICDLIANPRSASSQEIEQITQRMASVPFNQMTVSVPQNLQNELYMGQALGGRNRSQLVHLIKRIVDDKQWAPGTTETEYLDDLRLSILRADGSALVYQGDKGPVAAVLGSNRIPATHLGSSAEKYVFVVYSARDSIIITGYQTASEQELRIPKSAIWLNK